jgi:peptidoglycan-associated lipoprotein
LLESGAMSDTSALGDVFFDYDRFQIRKDAMPLLDANAGWLRANGSKTVLIEGHCDERGTVAYNLVLGEKRARAAKQYLQDLGVPTSQLQITSYGETRPFCTQQNEDCYQQNRRAHFVAK